MLTRLAFAFAVVGASLIACGGDDAASPSSTDSGADVSAADGGGADATLMPVMQIVGASGGMVTASGVVLTIPAGALAGDTTITIQPNAGAVPAGYTALSSLFSFGPDGTTFLTPVTVAFTISGGTAPTVYWSNAQGGYDPLATTVSANTASASVTHFSNGFVAEAQRVDGGVDATSGQDSSAADSAAVDSAAADSAAADSAAADSAVTDAASMDSAPADAGIADALADAGNTDAGFLGITVTIDGTPTSFGVSPAVVTMNGVYYIHADDNATTTHWTMQLNVTSAAQQQCLPSPQPAAPLITYTHYTSGVADSVYTTKQTGATCAISVTSTPVAIGDHARGTFSGNLDRAQDAGGGAHQISAGSYDVVY